MNYLSTRWRRLLGLHKPACNILECCFGLNSFFANFYSAWSQSQRDFLNFLYVFQSAPSETQIFPKFSPGLGPPCLFLCLVPNQKLAQIMRTQIFKYSQNEKMKHAPTFFLSCESWKLAWSQIFHFWSECGRSGYTYFYVFMERQFSTNREIRDFPKGVIMPTPPYDFRTFPNPETLLPNPWVMITLRVWVPHIDLCCFFINLALHFLPKSGRFRGPLPMIF